MSWVKVGKESERVKKTVRLHKLWDGMIREYSRRTGLSQRAVMESLFRYGNESFRREHGLGEESDEEKKREKDEVIDLAGRQLDIRAQETSCDRYTRNAIFGDLDLKAGVVRDEDLRMLEPLGIWDRLLGRKRIEWVPV